MFASNFKPLCIAFILLNTLFCAGLEAQSRQQLSSKLSLGYSTNIETYFIAERLAVEHISNYVFSNNTTDFSAQPMVTTAFEYFKPYVNAPVILRISKLLEQLRPILNDNAPILEFLLYKKPFPQNGFRLPFSTTMLFDLKSNPRVLPMIVELSDSLRQFYREAGVQTFLQQQLRFYKGAMKEVEKDLNPKIFPYIESYYGEHFSKYEFYIMPTMPITPGEDNYRGIGPGLQSATGKISTTLMSSSKMLSKKSTMSDYDSFGFANPPVTRLLTVHETGHSFVNPHILAIPDEEIDKDTILFTPAFQTVLANPSIPNWKVCLIEHLVRVCEIRIAVSMKDEVEAARLRKSHIGESNFILIPLLEEQLKVYETNRKKYPDFNSFLPVLMQFFHSLKPEQMDSLAKQHKHLS